MKPDLRHPAALIGLCLLPLGSAWAAPGGDLVPVLLLHPEPVRAPWRPEPEPPLIVGFAKVSDIQDGLPYRVGFYQVAIDALPGAGGGLTLAGRQYRAIPLCEAAPLAQRAESCAGLGAMVAAGPSAQGGEVALGYRFDSGEVWLSLGEHHATDGSPLLARPLGMAWIGGGAGAVDSRDLSVGTRIVTDLGQFQFDTGIGKSWFRGLGAAEHATMSVQWLRGAFGGYLGGSTLDFGERPIWAGFDFGLTWRTPWAGILQVGARQVPGTTKGARAGEPETPSALLDDLRPMPYVRYQQDL